MRQKILPLSEHPQHGGSMLIQNVGNHPPNHIMSHPRIITLLWELHILIKSICLHLSLSKSSTCCHTKKNCSTSQHNTSLYTVCFYILCVCTTLCASWFLFTCMILCRMHYISQENVADQLHFNNNMPEHHPFHMNDPPPHTHTHINVTLL